MVTDNLKMKGFSFERKNPELIVKKLLRCDNHFPREDSKENILRSKHNVLTLRCNKSFA